jgi:8-oxo-dGTP pyrophosphatase MutT (NUDIX family)
MGLPSVRREIMITQPVLAATTILIRESLTPHASTEVLLMRRPSEMSAFSEMWVFPGGKVDPADYSLSARECIAEEERNRFPKVNIATRPQFGDGQTPPELAILIAACREIFEEAGVLLARPRLAGGTVESLLERLLQRRQDFMGEPLLFFEALRGESLRLDVQALVPWARWITPPLVPKRFDTTFFAALFPAEQVVRPDARETSEARWIDLASITGVMDSTVLTLVPPTLINLLDLRRSLSMHPECAAMLRAERHRKILPIHPKVTKINGEPWAIFPWDSQYESLDGESSPAVQVPEHLRHLPGRLSTLAATRRPMR